MTAISGRSEDADEAADDEVEDALDGHVERAQLDVGDVEQRDALDLVHAGARADHLEEARHDVDLTPWSAQVRTTSRKSLVPRLREGDDHPVDAALAR